MNKKTSAGSSIIKYLSSNDTIEEVNISPSADNKDVFEESDSDSESIHSSTIKTVSEKEIDPKYHIDQKNIMEDFSSEKIIKSQLSYSSAHSQLDYSKDSDLEKSIQENLDYDPEIHEQAKQNEEESKEEFESISDQK